MSEESPTVNPALAIAFNAIDDVLFSLIKRKREQGKHLTDLKDPILGWAEKYRHCPVSFYEQNPNFENTDFELVEKRVRGDLEFESWAFLPGFFYPSLAYPDTDNKEYRTNYLTVVKNHNHTSLAGFILMNAYGAKSIKSDIDIAKILAKKFKITTILSTLPFHKKRSPEPFEIGELALNGNASACLLSFKQAVEEAICIRDFFRLQSGFSRIGIGGISLGSFVSAVSAGISEFDFNVQIYSSGSLSDIIWNSKRLQFLKNDFQSSGISKDRLQDYWTVIDPLNFIKTSKTIYYKLFLGIYDTVIRPSLALEYVDYLSCNNGLKINVDWVNHGHCTGILFVNNIANRIGIYINTFINKNEPRSIPI